MLDIRPLHPDLALVAKNELFENPDRMEEDVKAFRLWLEKSPHLKCTLNDQEVVSLLRCCKYSLERAKQKLDIGLTVRSLMPELFTNVSPISDEMKDILDLGMVLKLPLATPSSPRVFFQIDGLYDPNKYDMMQVMKVNGAVQEILYKTCDNFAIAGFVAIADQQYATLEHMKHLNPMFLKKIAYAFQEGSPYRVKGMHFINFSPWIVKFFNFFKMFLNEKMKSRIYVHESLEDLYKHVPREILPKEYGGNAGSIKDLAAETKKMVLDNEHLLKISQTFGTDEKKRPGRPKTSESVFGVEGSFRQLDFD